MFLWDDVRRMISKLVRARNSITMLFFESNKLWIIRLSSLAFESTTSLVNDWYQTAVASNLSMNLYPHTEWECWSVGKIGAFFIRCYRCYSLVFPSSCSGYTSIQTSKRLLLVFLCCCWVLVFGFDLFEQHATSEWVSVRSPKHSVEWRKNLLQLCIVKLELEKLIPNDDNVRFSMNTNRVLCAYGFLYGNMSSSHW